MYVANLLPPPMELAIDASPPMDPPNIERCCCNSFCLASFSARNFALLARVATTVSVFFFFNYVLVS